MALICSAFLVSLLSSSDLNLLPANNDGRVSVFPPTCNRIECPGYDVVHTGNGFEIRRYNSSMWMSTQPIDDVSLVSATRTGFLQLFEYIQGKNDNQQKADTDVGEEAAALYASVAGTVWADAIEKSQGGEGATKYIIAQYNSSFEFRNRVNEIWLHLIGIMALQF